MDKLCQEFGYASDGESFSVADKDEVWLLELIGKGKTKGAVWVASRVPEGFVGSTANQARTRTFAQNDPDNVLFAKDVVTFAQSVGLYPKDKPASEFSFSDVYDPITFTSCRLAEARVWNIFNQIAGKEVMAPYLDYAQGFNLTNRMPLFVKVGTSSMSIYSVFIFHHFRHITNMRRLPSILQAAAKLSMNDTMWNMRTHFEGTWFDNEGIKRADVGAGPGRQPTTSLLRFSPFMITVIITVISTIKHQS